MALIRKLLFDTSTAVMKFMLLRGCPSHSSDKKVILSTFDFLREVILFSTSARLSNLKEGSEINDFVFLLTLDYQILADNISRTDICSC